jgi:hypothetical protein
VQLRREGYECPVALHNMALMEHVFEAIPQTTFQFFVLGSDLACARHVSTVRYVSVIFSLRAALQVASLPKAGTRPGTTWSWTILFLSLQLVHCMLRFGALVVFALALNQHGRAVVYGVISLIVGGGVHVTVEVVHSRWAPADNNVASNALLSDELRTVGHTVHAFFFSSWIAFFVAAEVGPWDNIVLSPASLQVRPPDALTFSLRLMETYWLATNGLDITDVFGEHSHSGCTSWTNMNGTEHSGSGNEYTDITASTEHSSGSGYEYNQPAGSNNHLLDALILLEVWLYVATVCVPRRDSSWMDVISNDKWLDLVMNAPLCAFGGICLVALFIYQLFTVVQLVYGLYINWSF